MNITAKVWCNLKILAYGTGDDRFTTLGFMPDYADGRNKEWADATPHLDLRMSVRGDVADQFVSGSAYTLTFSAEE